MEYFDIHEACAEGDVESVRTWLDSDPKQRDALDGRGDTPLHVACFAGELEVVRLLIEKGADIHVKNRYEETPLHEACNEGTAEVVSLLLKHGATSDIEGRNDAGATPLFLAAGRSELGLEKANLLLEYGAKLDLNSAFCLKMYDHVESTVANSDWRREALFPDGLLHQAVLSGNATLVECLLRHGANANNTEMWKTTPLLMACFQAAPIDVVKLLLDHGADMNLADPTSGKRPLETAIELRNIELADLLRKYIGDK